MKHQDNTGKWYAGSNPESYVIGPCDTKEEAISEFHEDDPDYEGKVHVGIATAVYCSIDAEDVIERICDYMCDELYEDAMDGWCGTIMPPKLGILSDRLTKVFHEWLDEVGEQKCWNVIEEHLE